MQRQGGSEFLQLRGIATIESQLIVVGMGSCLCTKRQLDAFACE